MVVVVPNVSSMRKSTHLLTCAYLPVSVPFPTAGTPADAVHDGVYDVDASEAALSASR
jgi:hypothetical protein